MLIYIIEIVVSERYGVFLGLWCEVNEGVLERGKRDAFLLKTIRAKRVGARKGWMAFCHEEESEWTWKETQRTVTVNVNPRVVGLTY